MTSRTRVERWAPGFVQSLRLVLRPVIAYLVFNVLGFIAFAATMLWYSHNPSEIPSILFACFAGIVGVVVGQAVAIARARALPIFLVGGLSIFVGVWVVLLAHVPFPEFLGPAVFFFCFAFPCGMLSLQHRWELFASFWPAVGWIGGVFLILNENGRVSQWEHDKTSAWMPVPLFFLGCFLVLWVFYLASKQAMRVELWQSLSGAVARRVSKKDKARVGAVPRKNVLSLLLVAAILFAATAVLAPYLWRTGKGDKPTEQQTTEQHEEPPPDHGQPFDGEKLAKALAKLAQTAKETLLPILLVMLGMLLVYRPLKRGLLLTHLRSPILPTPPTERIDNLWEYVRIAAEDAGAVPLASDSVEELLERTTPAAGGAALATAADIYARTRYGFTVAPGDAAQMKPAALAAAKELRAPMDAWQHLKSWFRPLV